MAFAMSLSKRVFFIVALVGIIAMLVYLTQYFTNAPALVASSRITNTVAITGLDIGESLGYDYPALTSSHLSGLATGLAVTNEGRTEYSQALRLLDAGTNSFPGASIQFTENSMNEIGNFLVFDEDHAMFEYEVQFSSGLSSKMENGKLPDLHGERLKLLGTYFTIVDTRLDNNTDWVELKMFSRIGSVKFKDYYNDQTYRDDSVEVNGEVIKSKIQIIGYEMTRDIFTISSIRYRLMPSAKAVRGEDIYVPERHGTMQFLRQPQGMLNPSFEIIFAGMGNVVQQSTRSSGGGAAMIEIKPTSKSQYDIYFSTNTNRYRMPLTYLSGGTITLGDDDQTLVVTEGANNANYNINRNDLFLVSSGTNINDKSNIMIYERMNYNDGILYYADYNGGQKEANFDNAGYGQINVAGKNYDFYVSAAGNHPIVVDQTGDGNINGARAEIVLSGGLRLRLTTAGATATVRLIVPQRLFDEATADETTDVTIQQTSGIIDMTVANQASITMQSDEGSIDRGMTTFGLEFVLNEKRDPARLTIGRAGAGSRPTYTQSGGQSQGTVLITLEKEKFMKKKK